jgi:CheY-like chemotaxis protein
VKNRFSTSSNALSCADCSTEREGKNDVDATFEKFERPLVILAEDDHEMRRVLSKALERDGCEIIEEKNGIRLLNELQHIKDDGSKVPDIIISDIRMPGLSGLDVLIKIREWGWTVPVILITAFADQETRNEAIGQGASAFFSKPFNVDDLRTAVIFYLEHKLRRP